MISWVLKTTSDSPFEHLILVIYFGEMDWMGHPRGVVCLLPENHFEADGCLGHPPGYQ